jgi:predicted GIY-YIG superfamily endonuclease
MFYTYVLYSHKFDKIHVGYTSNLESRFLAHNELSTKGYTVKFRPWVIAFTGGIPLGRAIRYIFTSTSLSKGCRHYPLPGCP